MSAESSAAAATPSAAEVISGTHVGVGVDCSLVLRGVAHCVYGATVWPLRWDDRAPAAVWSPIAFEGLRLQVADDPCALTP
jgi:hypothetical protein